MTKIACPRCRSDATKLAAFLKNHSVAYCEYCGWNLPAATSRTLTDIRGGWVAGAIGLMLVLLAWKGPWGSRGALLIGFAFLWLPASLVLLGKYRLSRIKRVTISTAQTVDLSAADGKTQSNPELDQFSLVPRPRQVKMSWLGRFYTVGVVAATFLGLWLLSFMVQALVHPPPGAILKLVFGVAVYSWWCWICLAFFRNRIRERNLFMNGELAMGTVATRTEGREGAHIVYVFQAASGGAFQNRVFDFSKNQFEQMPVHVFYDSRDPSRSAALESSVYRVN